MTIFRIRKKYEQKIWFLGEICVKIGLTPDLLTVMAVPFSLGAAYALARGHYIWSLVGILLVALVDTLDGAAARAGKTANRFGTVLDHAVDRYAEFIIVAGAIANENVSPIWGMFAISGMIMASYVRAVAESAGKMAACTVGLAGRLEKVGIIVVGIGLEALGLRSALQWALIAVGTLSHVTALQRLLYARREIRRASVELGGSE